VGSTVDLPGNASAIVWDFGDGHNRW